MPETTPLIKAALNLRVGAGFDVYEMILNMVQTVIWHGCMEKAFKVRLAEHVKQWQMPLEAGRDHFLLFFSWHFSQEFGENSIII